MGDQLLPLPLTERSVHVCVDMQRIFSDEGPWPTPWMNKVLPIVASLASRHPERAGADAGYVAALLCALAERYPRMP
jgi:hypothetical protein